MQLTMGSALARGAGRQEKTMEQPRRNSLSNWRRAAFATALVTMTFSAGAEDIDIYRGTSTSTTAPNILFVLDNSSNFDSSVGAADLAKFSCTYADGSAPTMQGSVAGIQQCAMVKAIEGLTTGAVNIGFMGYNATAFAGAPYGCESGGKGGCLLRPLTLMTAETKAQILAWIKGWKLSESDPGYWIKAGPKANGSVFQEAWAYFAGQRGISGKLYSGSAAGMGCQKNYVVFLGNAYDTNSGPGDSNDATDYLLNTAPQVTAAQKVAIVPPYASITACRTASANHTATSGLWADEWARYMHQTGISPYDGSQGITTYTIGILGSDCRQTYPALLTTMANYGGGKYYASYDFSGVYNAISEILNEVQAVNSVFASVSLPISVNAQGTYDNQVFLGMFRPDARGLRRWAGNLKQYQVGVRGNDAITLTLFLADRDGHDAISGAGTGFISPNAISYWTKKDTSAAPDNNGGFWRNNPQGISRGYDLEDGEIVEKGGAAQLLRLANLTADARNLYTCTGSGGSTCGSGSSLSATPFATTNAAITASALGVDSSVRDNLIAWVRGADNLANSELGPGSPVRVRPSIHGDVLHSRPVVVNYGTTTGVVAFYGSNDGTYHAVNANKASKNIGGIVPGGELWSFIPQEFFSKLKRLYENTSVHYYTTSTADSSATPRDYYFDGPTGLYQSFDGTTTQKAWIFLTARRGGRILYALDVTDPTAPKFLWKRSCSQYRETESGTCDAGYEELGQTWSHPKAALVKGWKDADGKPRPVLIFGAGYYGGYHDKSYYGEDAATPGPATMGRGIFIVDAETGCIVWKAGPAATVSGLCAGGAASVQTGMTYAMPGDVTLVNRDYDGDGYVDRLYAADVGGNIWRVDLEPASDKNTPAFWQVSKFASLGGSSANKRKFLFGPDVVLTKNFDLVIIASGDREHPLYENTEARQTVNKFYALYDKKTGMDATGAATIVDSSESSSSTASAGLFLASSGSAVPAGYWQTGNGFYFPLSRDGEKGVNAVMTVAGYSYFGTNQPENPETLTCATSLGTARGYAVNLFTGQADATNFAGGGLAPSPIAGVVNVPINGVSTPIATCFGCGVPGSADLTYVSLKDATAPGSGPTQIRLSPERRRTYWYIDKHDN